MGLETLFYDLGTALLPVLGIILSYVLVSAGRFIVELTNKSSVIRAFEQLEKIILSTVMALMQTLVDDIKANKTLNKLSNEEARLVKNKALTSIKDQMNSKQIKILEKNFNSLDELIDNILEQKVLEVKMRRGHY